MQRVPNNEEQAQLKAKELLKQNPSLGAKAANLVMALGMAVVVVAVAAVIIAKLPAVAIAVAFALVLTLCLNANPLGSRMRLA